MLASAVVYLAAALVSVPLAKKLGLGSVLGYIIAGVLIGPSLLGLVGDQTATMHVAEFGVVMMLFLVGLELQPRLLWQIKKAIIGLGGLQVIITSGVFFSILLLGFGMRWETALAIALMLALSSTAIALQTLSEKGWLKLEGGQNSFAVLLFQDIAVIPMLALMPLLAFADLSASTHQTGSIISHLPVWQQISIAVLAIVLIIASGKLLVNPIFRFIAELRLREAFTIFALFIVVAIASLMSTLGLSPALGTFLAGVVLAESEYRHELETDIEPFKGLLLGLFFITVGASIDFTLLWDEIGFITLLVTGLLLVKILILAALSFAFNMAKNQKVLFTLAICQGGEFAFVLLSLTSGLAILSPYQVSILTLVVAISMLLSPLLILLYGRLETSSLSPTMDEGIDSIRPSDKVIIAGYGRFGQIVGRLLMHQGVNISILDHSPSQIELVRRFNGTVYYGDATRHDLLAAAGAKDATLIVIAVDTPDQALAIVECCQKHFPHLKIACRAFDRRHLYALMKLKVDIIKRETFDSSLNLGIQALELLGTAPEQAQQAAQDFVKLDDDAIQELYHHWGDDEGYHVAYKQRHEMLKQVLDRDKLKAT